jgi:hypothetical protein
MAQTIVKGKITDNQQKPLSGVSVQLGKTNTITDTDGIFSFYNI